MILVKGLMIVMYGLFAVYIIEEVEQETVKRGYKKTGVLIQLIICMSALYVPYYFFEGAMKW